MPEILQHREKEPLLDHCGIVAAYSTSDIQFFTTGLSGLVKLQTRGIDGAGVYARSSTSEINTFKGKDMINKAFDEDTVRHFRDIHAKTWLLQTRYGTNGDGQIENIQPIVRKHTDGSTFSIVVNGEFSAGNNPTLDGKSDTVIFAEELARRPETTWDKRILAVQENKNGAWSMAIETPDALYLTRDKYGIRPLAYGCKKMEGEKVWIAASETAALLIMGICDIKEILPDSVIKLDDKGLTILKSPVSNFSSMAMCIFENVYLGNGNSKVHRPRGTMNTIMMAKEPTISDFRIRCGQILASEERIIGPKDVDFAIGIPGTGIAGGKAYAEYLGIPYIQAIIDRRPQEYDARTFINPAVSEIRKTIEDHFYFETNYLKDARVVCIDDSLVRANISSQINEALRKECQIKSFHLRILCPPIDKACYLGINTRTNEELIAYKHSSDIEKIRKEIGVDSLAFLSDKGLLEATGKREGFCMGCMLGHHPPIDRKGNIIYERK